MCEVKWYWCIYYYAWQLSKTKRCEFINCSVKQKMDGFHKSIWVTTTWINKRTNWLSLAQRLLRHRWESYQKFQIELRKFKMENLSAGCHLPFHCARLRRNFAHKSNFILDAFPLTWVSGFVNIHFLHLCNLRVYAITLNSI